MKKWNQTHERLQHAAWELFAAHGFDATGTAQIAQAAGVTEVTLFRHFPSKEALVLDDPFDPEMASAVRIRPPHEPCMRALTEGIREALGELDPHAMSAQRERLKMLASTPSLAGAIERNSLRTIEALADALLARGNTRVASTVAATSAIAGLSSALLHWAKYEEDTLERTLDMALNTLGGLSSC